MAAIDTGTSFKLLDSFEQFSLKLKPSKFIIINLDVVLFINLFITHLMDLKF